MTFVDFYRRQDITNMYYSLNLYALLVRNLTCLLKRVGLNFIEYKLYLFLFQYKQYRTLEKVASDLNLVFQNAKQYNKEESKIHQV